MPSSAFIRSGGLMAVVGGVAWTTGWAAQQYFELDRIKGVSLFVLLLGAMAAVTALHILQRERYGLGSWFALTAFIGLALMLAYELIGAVTERYLPGVAWIFAVGTFAATMGIVFLGAISIATRVLPWWCGAALTVSGPSFTALLGPGVGVAWVVVGYAIFRAGAPVRTPSVGEAGEQAIGAAHEEGLSLIGWCGVAAILAGALFAAWGYVDGGFAPSAYLNVTLAALAIVVPTLFLVGLVGLHTWCADRVNWLGEVGFVLGFIGSAAGSMRGLEDLIGWYGTHVLGYTNLVATGMLLNPWIDWLFLLSAGLLLVGFATTRIKASSALHALPLAMGAFGWAYLLTDSGGVLETRLGHVSFGVLFSLSWGALGVMLWYQWGATNDRTPRSS